MSTWISDPAPVGRHLRPGLLASLLLLAGCTLETGQPDDRPAARLAGTAAGTDTAAGGGLATLFRGFGAARAAKPPLKSVALAGGAVVVAGPEGYCIDPGSVRRTGGGFALLASCNILTEGRGGIYVDPAILSVTVGARNSAPATLAADDLARALAPYPVTGKQDAQGLALVRVGKGGDEAVPGSDPRHWRGAMISGNRMVTLGLYAPEGSTMTGASGGALLRALANRIRTASEPAKDEVATANSPSGATNRENSSKGFFRRLFN